MTKVTEQVQGDRLELLLKTLQSRSFETSENGLAKVFDDFGDIFESFEKVNLCINQHRALFDFKVKAASMGIWLNGKLGSVIALKNSIWWREVVREVMTSAFTFPTEFFNFTISLGRLDDGEPPMTEFEETEFQICDGVHHVFRSPGTGLFQKGVIQHYQLCF